MRGCDCWLNLKLNLNWRLLIPSPVFEMYILPTVSIVEPFQELSLERVRYFENIWMVFVTKPIRPLSKLLRFWQESEEIYEGHAVVYYSVSFRAGDKVGKQDKLENLSDL